MLLNRAYFKYRRFALIDEIDGFFVTRLKRSANPEIDEELRAWPGNAKPLVGSSVWDVTEELYRKEIDVLVAVIFKRRPYRGTRSPATRRFRVGGMRNGNTGEYHCYLTNLPHEEFTPDQIAALYPARWEVEILFRQLKYCYELDAIQPSKPAIVEVLILVSILTLVISWVLLGVLREHAEECGEDLIFPLERWAKTFETFAPFIADQLASHLGFDPRISFSS